MSNMPSLDIEDVRPLFRLRDDGKLLRRAAHNPDIWQLCDGVSDKITYRDRTDRPVCRRKYQIAYALFHGVSLYPGQIVDHRSGDSEDNHPANLRLVTAAENAQNRKTLGVRGLTYAQASNTLMVSVPGAPNCRRIKLKGRWRPLVLAAAREIQAAYRASTATFVPSYFFDERMFRQQVREQCEVIQAAKRQNQIAPVLRVCRTGDEFCGNLLEVKKFFRPTSDGGFERYDVHRKIWMRPNLSGKVKLPLMPGSPRAERAAYVLNYLCRQTVPLFPGETVDHIRHDCTPAERNRYSNLRRARASQQIANRPTNSKDAVPNLCWRYTRTHLTMYVKVGDHRQSYRIPFSEPNQSARVNLILADLFRRRAELHKAFDYYSTHELERDRITKKFVRDHLTRLGLAGDV